MLEFQAEYVRSLVLQGQVWRLLTASLTHTNLNHLLFNLGTLAALLTIAHRLGRLRAALIILPLACILSNALLLLFPSLEWYRGLSGGLYGLAAFLIAGMLTDAQHRNKATIALTALMLKCTYDAFADSPYSSTLIAARVAWEAHVTGVAAGILLALMLHAYRWSLIFRK